MQKIIEYLFYIFVFLLPIQTRYIVLEGYIAGGVWEYGTISIYASEIILWCLLLIFGYFILKHARAYKKNFIWNKKNFLIVAVYGFVLWSVISIFWSYQPYLSFYSAFRLIEAIAFFIFILLFQFDMVRFFFAATLAGIVQGILAITQLLTQIVISSKWLGMAFQAPYILGSSVVENNTGRFLRSYGSLSHPNILGGWLAIVLLLSCYGYFSTTNIRMKKIFQYGVALEIVGLLSTFSRSALLAFFLGLIIYLLLLWHREKFQIIKIVFWVIIPTLLFSIIFNDMLLTRLFGINRLEVKSLQEHVVSYQTAASVIKNHKLFGVGVGNYTYAVYREINSKYPAYEYQPTHNMFILIFSELGIIGMLMFFIFLYVVASFVMKKRNPISLALLTTLLILSFFDHYLWSLYFGIILFWMVFGFIIKQSNHSNI